MIHGKYEDIPSIVRLTKEFHKESKQALPFDEVVFSSTVARLISDDNGCVILYKGDGKVQGFIMGWVSQYPAANVLQANEVLWFCSSSYRGRGALKLINQYIQWAKSKNAKVIYAGAFEAKASRVYKRLGFTCIDENWVMVK